MRYLLAWLIVPSLVFAASGTFNVGFQTSDSAAPTVPSGLTATAVSNTQINLSWTASTDTFGVAGYRIFRDLVFIATSTVTNYSDTGLTASTSYSYTVSAFDAALNISAHSATATAATTDTSTPASTSTAVSIVSGSSGGTRSSAVPPPPFLPVAVSGLRLLTLTDQLVFSWNNPVLPEFSGVRIIRSTKGFPIDAYDGLLVFQGEARSFIDVNILPGQNYYYGVFALYDNGQISGPAVVYGAIVPPVIDQVLPPVEIIKLADFIFKQDGRSLDIVDGLLQVKSGLPIEVVFPAKMLPDNVRVLALQLSGESDALLGDWVLFYNRNTDVYELVLPGLTEGTFSVKGLAYDANFEVIGEGDELIVAGMGDDYVEAVAEEVGLKSDLFVWLAFLLFLVLLLVVSIYLFLRRKKSA